MNHREIIGKYPPIINRFIFIYISKKESYIIFNGPKLYYPFDADDVFAEMINSKDMDTTKKLIQFNFICDEGMILAIHPNGKTTTLALSNGSRFSGRRFTLEILEVKDFDYYCFITGIWYNILDALKYKLIKYFIPKPE
jgi:hypothetical protein